MNPVKVKYRVLLFLIVVFIACNNGSNKNKPLADTLTTPTATATAAASPNPKDILDTLSALPFVKEDNRNIDSVTHHQHGMAFIIDSTDNTLEIRAGYDGPDRFETYYIFSVDKKTRAITLEDVISGDTVTPEEFEKRRKTRQY